MSYRIIALSCIAVTLVVAGSGCRKNSVAEAPATGPDYSRRLAPGQSALRLITDPARMPDLGMAYRNRNVFLLDAIDNSLGWFTKPSSKTFFPFEGITHEQANASLMAFAQQLQSASNEQEFVNNIKQMFNVYESVGYNGEGIVLYTGYYSPIFKASRTKSTHYRYPLYLRPDDLATDPKTGQPLGRKLPNGQVVPYYTRAEIERANLFAGRELVWLEDQLSAYIIHVNGSARLRLDDGTDMYVGYAGKTDRPYSGLGQAMLDAKLVKPHELSLPAIRRAFQANPEKVIELMNRNQSYVFFMEYPDDKWPSGSLGFKVTAETSLATDKKIYPRAGIVLVDTNAVHLTMGKQRFMRFMLDQDTGGAIQAPGRADIYMGQGATAEILAGGQYAEGRLYYIILKPEYVDQYLKTGPMHASR